MSLYFSLLVLDDRSDFDTPKSAIHGPLPTSPGFIGKADGPWISLVNNEF